MLNCERVLHMSTEEIHPEGKKDELKLSKLHDENDISRHKHSSRLGTDSKDREIFVKNNQIAEL